MSMPIEKLEALALEWEARSETFAEKISILKILPRDQFNAEHARYAKQLRTLIAEHGWRPIEEAPKGRKIQVAYKNRLCNWRITNACFHTQLEWDFLSDNYDDDDGQYAPADWYEECENTDHIYRMEINPTHWMPLSTPPKGPEHE